MSEPLLLATRSQGKLRELRPLFRDAGFDVLDLVEAGIPETAEEENLEAFDSFEENALAKARYFHRLSARPTIADDSGLEVLALGGAPGVRSKRWSGRVELAGEELDAANNERLLQALRSQDDRRARYVCVAAYVDGRGELTRRGETTGEILRARALGTEGFGYDPYFLSSELGRSFAAVDRAEKARVSHRGRAFRALLAALRAPLDDGAKPI